MKWMNDHFFDMDHLAAFLAGFAFLAAFGFLATFLAIFLVLAGAALLRVSAMVLVFLDLACFLNPASLEAMVWAMVEVLAAFSFLVNFLPSLTVAAIVLVFLTI